MHLKNRVKKLEKLQFNVVSTNSTTDYAAKLKALRQKRAVRNLAEAEKMLAQGAVDLQKGIVLLAKITISMEKDPTKENLIRLQEAKTLTTTALNHTGEQWQHLYEEEKKKYTIRGERRLASLSGSKESNIL